jgi:hypothetical protein
MDTDPCTTADPMFCTYGDIGCACVRIMGMRREWRCRGLADAGRDADCPSMPPAQGTSCADAGAGTVCRYPGNTLCACGMMDQWVCTL